MHAGTHIAGRQLVKTETTTSMGSKEKDYFNELKSFVSLSGKKNQSDILMQNVVPY